MHEQITYSGDKYRLDKYLSDIFSQYSRAQWARYIRGNHVLVNEKSVNKDYLLKHNDVIAISIVEPKKVKIELDTVFKDRTIVVLNKPSGVLSVQKDENDNEYTAEDFVSDNYPDFGLVHRLDRGTSGLLMAASSECQEPIKKMFADRKIVKKYIAVVEGSPKEDEFIVDIPIERSNSKEFKYVASPQGRESTTKFTVVGRLDKLTTLVCAPKTGRTHQLRVHLSHLNLPIVGDNLYGSKKQLSNNRFLLHALALEFTYNDNNYKIVSEIPTDMKEFFAEISVEDIITS